MRKKDAAAGLDLFTGEAHREKYQSGNWIARKLVDNFMTGIVGAVRGAGNAQVHEIGCGEGHILGVLAGNGFSVRGCDLSESSLAGASRGASRRGFGIPLVRKRL